MIINALNTNVATYMSDFEDSQAPTWDNCLDGQVNLYDAIRNQVDFDTEKKPYKLTTKKWTEGTYSRGSTDTRPTLLVRPRGWHMLESHVQIDGQSMSGSLFDFGLFFFNNAKALIEAGRGPYFYLPRWSIISRLDSGMMSLFSLKTTAESPGHHSSYLSD